MPMLLTVDDAAELPRTTKRAIDAMIERRQPLLGDKKRDAIQTEDVA